MSGEALLLHTSGAFVLGGGWVAFATWMGDARGSALGGLIAGLPSTVAFGFLFIGWNQSAAVAAQAATEFPLLFSLTGVFLLSYATLAPRGFWKAMGGSLTIWAAAATGIVVSGLHDFYDSLGVCMVISASVIYIFASRLKLQKVPSSRPRNSLLRSLGRFVLGGTIVALAVLSSQLAGPDVGAVPTSFPAVSLSVVYVLNRTQGREFSRAIAPPLAMTAMLTVIPYGVCVKFLYPQVGVAWGTALAYFATVPFVLASYYLAHSMLLSGPSPAPGERMVRKKT